MSLNPDTLAVQFPGGIGASVERVEDARLVTGNGRFVDDLQPHGMLHAYILRSPHAHADIVSIDVVEAVRMPGVACVLTAQDYMKAGFGLIPCTVMPPGVPADSWFRTPFPPLADKCVRHVGDGVAMIVAQTLEQAMDASELIQIEYAPLPAITSVREALKDGAQAVWADKPDNVCFSFELGNHAETIRALEQAECRLDIDILNPRLAGVPLEPRSYLGTYDCNDQRLQLVTSTQNPHRIRHMLAELIFRMPSHRIHVTAGDVGGSFGTKGGLYPEEILVCWAAMRLGKPVKWVATRSESFLSDFHGRDQWACGTVGFDTTGRIAALRLESNHNIGSHAGPSAGITATQCSRMLSGVYDIPAMHATVRGVMTNTRPLTPYRGAGRPEAAFLIESVVDAIATRLGLDPVTVRRLNFIRPDQMPYTTGISEVYDCGEFEILMDKTLAAADWDGFPARREASLRAGKLRGRGVSCYIEISGSANERMEIRFDPTGWPTIVAGTFSHGQGHETVFRQMVSEWLGIPSRSIGFLQGDTDTISYGRGTNASRSMAVGGSALKRACDEVIGKGRRIAAHMLKTPVEDITFSGGHYHACDGKSISLNQVAKASYLPAGHPIGLGVGLEGVGVFSSTPANYPNGCHAVELEIDPRTGVVTLQRYFAGDDVGRAINPLLLEGQVHGGIAQGIGQALLEQIIYDDNGQMLTGSFVDYAMPKAAHTISVGLLLHNVPTSSNLIGAKGAGEVGAVGAPPAIIQALENALASVGLPRPTMPATPLKIWESLQQAKLALPGLSGQS